MPVHKTKGGGWKYGHKGKTYYGKKSVAKRKAYIQAYAIQKSQERAGKRPHKA